MVSGLELKGYEQCLLRLSKTKPLSLHISYISIVAKPLAGWYSLVAAVGFPLPPASPALFVLCDRSENMIVWTDTGAERIKLFSAWLTGLEVCVVARQVDVIR